MDIIRRRWIPAVVAPILVIGSAVALPMAAGAAPSLPEKSAEEVLELVAGSADAAFSGTIEQRSDLGLPELGTGSSDDSTAGGVAAAIDLLTGSHTARIYVGGPDQLRFQVLDRVAERNVVLNGTELWTYDSETKEATHLSLPEKEEDRPASGTSPDSLAASLIDNIDESTIVEVTTTARVAGRSVYQLVLSPRTPDTLFGSVTLSVDSETGLPLSVVISARGQSEPAFSSAFTRIEFGTPDAARFSFSPPAAATVTELTLPEGHDGADHASPDTDAPAGETRPTVLGEGWASVLALPAGDRTAVDQPAQGSNDGRDGGDGAALLDRALTQVDGGRALETALITVLITDDGRVFVGAVPLERLVAAAAAA